MQHNTRMHLNHQNGDTKTNHNDADILTTEIKRSTLLNSPVIDIAKEYLVSELEGWKKALLTNDHEHRGYRRNKHIKYSIILAFEQRTFCQELYKVDLITEQHLEKLYNSLDNFKEYYTDLTSIERGHLPFPTDITYNEDGVIVFPPFLAGRKFEQQSEIRPYEEAIEELTKEVVNIIDEILISSNTPSRDAKTKILAYQNINLVAYNIVDEIYALSNKLLIDQNSDKPQSGFAGRTTYEDTLKRIFRNRGNLVTLEKEGQIRGYYTLHGVSYYQKHDHVDNLVIFLDNNNLLKEKVGFVQEVGISHSGSLSYRKEHNRHAHQDLLEQIKYLAKEEGYERIFGFVRVGEKVNLALNDHKKLGWKLFQDQTLDSNGLQYKLMYLDIK